MKVYVLQAGNFCNDCGGSDVVGVYRERALAVEAATDFVIASGDGSKEDIEEYGIEMYITVTELELN